MIRRLYARLALCRRLHVRLGTPPATLRAFANDYGDQRAKLLAQYL